MKTKKNTGRMGMILLVFTIFSLCLVSAGGFASSSLKKDVDGEKYFGIPVGESKSFFIYPQNLGEETLLFHIEFTEGGEFLTTELEEFYEIPPNTKSDEYVIELVFALEDDESLIGTKYPVKYRVSSKVKDAVATTEIVAFDPIGFQKHFYILAQSEEAMLPPRPTNSGTNSPPRTDEIDLLVAEAEGVDIVGRDIVADRTEEEPEGEGSNTLPILLGLGVLLIVGTSVIVKKYGDI